MKITVMKPTDIPEQLQVRPNWVAWKSANRDGKPTKIPVNPKTGGNAMSNKPETWTTFEAALDYYWNNRNNGVCGIGFQLGKGITPFVGIDIDHCRDPQTGDISPFARDIMRRLNSYSEVTPSGTGIRIFVVGELPPAGRKKGNLEVYDANRFLTVTGDHLEGTHRTIEERYSEILELHREVFGGRKEGEGQHPVHKALLEDKELVGRAMSAKNGEHFNKLYGGDWQGLYFSQSEADLAFCCDLAFWSAKNAEQMDRIVRQSRLYRAKWDEPHHAGGSTYGEVTIRKAIETVEEIYRPDDKSGSGSGRRRRTAAAVEKVSRSQILEALDANEDGDSSLFIEIQQGRFVYDHNSASWYVFCDHHWRADTTDKAVAALQEVIDLYGAEVERRVKCRLEAEKAIQKEQAQQHEKLEEALFKRMRQLQSLKRKMDVLRLASADWSGQGRPSLALTGEEWDRHPMLLGVENGVIDLTSGEHRAGNPRDYIKTFAPTEWLGLNEPALTWERFLQEVFAGDQELIDCIQRLLGYGITGRTSEHILPIFYGSRGRNGKGTLLETLHKVLGELAVPIEAEMLLLQSHGRQSGAPASDIMALRGRRLVWASETGEGRYLDAGKLKWLTGGDTLTGRVPYGKRQDTFSPTHTVILLTNHRPHAAASDHALWARIHLIPFSQSFVDDPTKPNEHKRDPSLLEKLAREASGILAWLVRGCLLWQKEGLRPPKAVLAATESYRMDEDLIGNFLSECCIVGENAETPAGKLYKAYQQWCAQMGHKSVSGTKFGMNLKDRFDSYEDRRGTFYRGLGLLVGDCSGEGD